MRFLLLAFVLASAGAMLQNCRLLNCPVNTKVLSSADYTIRTTPPQYREGKPISGIAESNSDGTLLLCMLATGIV